MNQNEPANEAPPTLPTSYAVTGYKTQDLTGSTINGISAVDTLAEAREKKCQQAKLEEIRILKRRRAERELRRRQRQYEHQRHIQEMDQRMVEPIGPPGMPESLSKRSKITIRTRESTCPIEAPAPPRLIKPFSARSPLEYQAFTNRLTVHFLRYGYWFTNDHRKVACAVCHLDTKRKQIWSRETNDFTEDRTWSEFESFCRGCMGNPRDLERQCALRYESARQREFEKVTDLVNYLEALESCMTGQYSESQQKRHLYAKVLPVLRREESLRMVEEPESYNDYVNYLQSIEDSTPERQGQLRNARKKKTGNKRKR